MLREATEAEQTEIDTLEARRAALEAECEVAGDDEERQAKAWEELEPVETRLGEIDAQRQVVDPEQQACAGAVVSIGRDGKIAVERDLLRPEDTKRFTRNSRATPAAPKGARLHSAALVRRLTAQQTLALQAVLARRPDVAILALTHRLVLRTFSLYGGERLSVVQVDARRPSAGGHVAGGACSAVRVAARSAA
jgi:ParB family chromosome partitioning protein